MEHLVVIIDENGIIEPKLYACPEESKTKEESLKSAKQKYENKYKISSYKSYHFIH